MGILSNAVSICQFKVIGERGEPTTDMFDWASLRLATFKFKPIDSLPEERSIGWVHLDDHTLADFLNPGDFFRDHFITMSLRKDERRIPNVVLKSHLKSAQKDFLEANPSYRSVPKDKKEELLEAVKSKLLTRILPSLSKYDALWDTDSNMVYFTSLSSKIIDLFVEQFQETFEGLRLSLIHPYARAEMIIDDKNKAALRKLNKSSKDDTLSLINANLWIGWDFLNWVMFQTMNGKSEYYLKGDGPIKKGLQFVSYIDDKLVLIGEDDKGVQKVTVTGTQTKFNEVRTALRDNKKITEATIRFEMEEEHWKITLKGDRFYFSSIKFPSVTIEKDNQTDKSKEDEAVFYDKTYLLEKGLHLFDSLFLTFLHDRLSIGWEEKEKIITQSLNKK